MPFIPNYPDAAFPDQAEPDSVDFEIMLAGTRGDGVLSGCAVTASIGITPLDLSGLIAWYDFGDITSLWKDTARTSAVTADGDLIAGVTDKSGNGNHLAQATSGNRPVYKVSIQDGKSVARFAVVNGTYMTTGSFAGGTLTQPTTIFAACMPRATNLGTIVCDGIASGNRHLFNAQSTGVDEYIYAGNVLAGAYAVVGTWYAYAWKFNTTASKLYRGGGTANASGDAGSQTLTGLTLGEAYNHPGTSALDGDIGELFICNASLSNADIDLAGDYMTTHWGLTDWSPVS